MANGNPWKLHFSHLCKMMTNLFIFGQKSSNMIWTKASGVMFTCAFVLRRLPVSWQTLARGGVSFSFAVGVCAARVAPVVHWTHKTPPPHQHRVSMSTQDDWVNLWKHVDSLTRTWSCAYAKNYKNGCSSLTLFMEDTGPLWLIGMAKIAQKKKKRNLNRKGSKLTYFVKFIIAFHYNSSFFLNHISFYFI